MKKDDKITVMKEYVSNQTANAFMRHGVEKYFHEYIIVVDDDWYTPCEFISEFGLEDSFGPEYVFEQVVIAVKSSIKWLKKQGFKPDENSDDDSYNLYMMIDFIKNIKDSPNQLNESGGLFDYVLNESLSSSLKESERSLEWLLDKAYVSEYRMVGKNSAEVRVRHTPELLTSDSMAARFEEDIPDGYKLEVDFLGEDPILGRNFDIYEVQLLKN